eukprot:SAG11_NODE_2879_length_2876_cov_1.398632_2_plen_69_part_00
MISRQDIDLCVDVEAPQHHNVTHHTKRRGQARCVGAESKMRQRGYYFSLGKLPPGFLNVSVTEGLAFQ